MHAQRPPINLRKPTPFTTGAHQEKIMQSHRAVYTIALKKQNWEAGGKFSKDGQGCHEDGPPFPWITLEKNPSRQNWDLWIPGSEVTRTTISTVYNLRHWWRGGRLFEEGLSQKVAKTKSLHGQLHCNSLIAFWQVHTAETDRADPLCALASVIYNLLNKWKIRLCYEKLNSEHLDSLRRTVNLLKRI